MGGWIPQQHRHRGSESGQGKERKMGDNLGRGEPPLLDDGEDTRGGSTAREVR